MKMNDKMNDIRVKILFETKGREGKIESATLSESISCLKPNCMLCSRINYPLRLQIIKAVQFPGAVNLRPHVLGH